MYLCPIKSLYGEHEKAFKSKSNKNFYKCYLILSVVSKMKSSSFLEVKLYSSISFEKNWCNECVNFYPLSIYGKVDTKSLSLSYVFLS